MKKAPKNWMTQLTFEVVQKATKSDVKDLLDRAQEKYVTWDTFRHYPMADGLKPEEGWVLLKFTHRMSSELTPAKDKEGNPFVFNLHKALYKKLSYIDTHAAGLVNSFQTQGGSFKEQLIMSNLTEEAIASSQIEGANTSRKVAKDMLYSGRQARTLSEQMIINNYQVMQELAVLKEFSLTEEILLDIQRKITNKTLEEEGDAGRFRVNADEIVVKDRVTGEIVFVPPNEAQMRQELKRLIEYANNDAEEDRSYIHYFLKACILHFWFAYLHPFVDGNGRTARAIFYWYLLKKKYWLFEYLSISRIIKTAKKKYDQAFLDTEEDDNDLTYFVNYIAGITCRAIDEMQEHYIKKVEEAENLRNAAQKLSQFNERQIAVLTFFKNNKNRVTNIGHHQKVHAIVYETARQDLLDLKKKGFLVETEKGKKKIYIPNIKEIKRILR